MKRIFLIFTIFSAGSCIAQTACSRNTTALFTFNSAPTGYGKEIHTLGSNPEFPFLRNKSSAGQVYAAIMKNDRNNGRGVIAFNNLMMDVGFTNGAKDMDASSITEATIPYGTEGNMGSGGYKYGYCKLTTDPNGTRAWKISSGGDCYVYILQKCGNAFFPNTPKRTACVNAPVSISADTKEVTLDGGTPSTTTDKVYVYYHRRKHPKRSLAPEFADIPDANASNPILLSATKDMHVLPQSYKVTVNTPDDMIQVCPDLMLDVPATINVEKESEYTGNYPVAKKNYKEVSRRVYRKTARKMRKAERKENRVARLTGTSVNVPVQRS